MTDWLTEGGPYRTPGRTGRKTPWPRSALHGPYRRPPGPLGEALIALAGAVAVMALLGALMLGVITLAGCGSWQRTAALSLQTAAKGLSAVHTASRPAWHRKCLAIAKRCTVRADACQPLQSCQSDRGKFNAWLQRVAAGIDTARIALLAAIAADSEEQWRGRVEAAVVQVLGELAKLREHARVLGVL